MYCLKNIYRKIFDKNLYSKLKKFILFKFWPIQLSLMPIKERFTYIYVKNYWGSNESRSGEGSTLAATKNLRSELPKLISAFKIKSIFDGPCGDFNWMRHVVEKTQIVYIGGDIVRPLINENLKRFKGENIKFIEINLISEAFPFSDLMISRDFLFHLSFSDTVKVLRNFVNSKTPFLLTTSHIDNSGLLNKDITTGDFRFIDLFSSPYNFPKSPLLTIRDFSSTEPPRAMYLFSRDQIVLALKSWGKEPAF